jgi:hypothetical protein
MDKLIINCTTGEIEEVSFTPEEIAQREYESSFPVLVTPTLEERIASLEETTNFLLGL